MQCREKWHNVLDPLLDRGPFTPEDDSLIIQEVNKYNSAFNTTTTSSVTTSATPGVAEGLVEEETDNNGDGAGGSSVRSIKWNLIAAKLSTRRTDNQVARRWKELFGTQAFREYKEGSRKRRAIVPQHHNRCTQHYISHDV
jgi:hypothetical protein